MKIVEEQYGQYSDDQLLALFSKGDKQAFTEIYKRYWFTLYSVAYKQLGSKPDAEELVQTVFERIWKKRDSLAIRNIAAYLTVSLRNVLIDFFRQRAHEKNFRNNHHTLLEANLTEEEVNRAQLVNTIENLVQQLPSKTQTVFRLSRYEGKTVQEIANKLQLTNKAVEYHITQSIRHLRQYLREYLSLFL